MEKVGDVIQTSKLNMASYGFGKFLNEFIEMAFTSFYFFFYERAIGLNTVLVGIAFIIYAIWNAVNDPLVGYFTNRPYRFTKKWGRRKPWILIGGVPWVLSFILIFTPPVADPVAGQFFIFLWAIFSTCLYDFFGSIFFVNFASLFPDKFRSVRERRLATGIQTPIGIFGVALGALLPAMIVDYDIASTYVLMAGVMIIIGLIVLGLSVPGYRENQELIDRFLSKHEKRERWSFFESLRNSFKLKSFAVFITTYTLYRCLVISMQASIPYVVEYVLGETAAIQTILSAGFLIGALISSPFWIFLAQKTNNNKRIMLFNSILLTVFTVPLYFFNSVPTLFIGLLLWGAGLGGFWTMISPVLADVIDDSIVKFGKRDEGVYNGFQQFFGRMGLFFQVIIFTTVHVLTGFQERAPLAVQPPEAIIGIQIHFSIIPAIVMLIGTIIFWRYYKLTPDVVTENQIKVEEMGL
ncbi:MAG: MFS transporter [Promethearchaeota archaeon]|nr:MAG: MFS transporter [Candidatus Lokiarchaeota archaeon]